MMYLLLAKASKPRSVLHISAVEDRQECNARSQFTRHQIRSFDKVVGRHLCYPDDSSTLRSMLSNVASCLYARFKVQRLRRDRLQ
jgi:hypothetical protein